jgi:hypothetical protein
VGTAGTNLRRMRALASIYLKNGAVPTYPPLPLDGCLIRKMG